MGKEVKEKVANLLDEASKLLLTDSWPNSSLTVPSFGGDFTWTSGGTTSSTLGETLQTSGLYRRLNTNERLRAASPYQQSRQTSAEPASQGKS